MTNIPPQAAAQYRKVMQSRTPQEKIRNLKLYLSMIPKHKGTARLQRQIRRQISQLEDEITERQLRKARTRIARQLFEKDEDSPLVILIGRTLCGKSSILSRLTSAQPRITGIPYATQSPQIGGYSFGSVIFRIVELPAIRPNSTMPSNHLRTLRRSDLVSLVIDLGKDIEEQMQIVEELRQRGIYSGLPSRAVKIERRAKGGISIVGSSTLVTRDVLLRALRADKIDSAVVRIGPLSTLDDLRAAVRGLVAKPTLILANKTDTPGARRMYRKLLSRYGRMYNIVRVSASTGIGLERIGEAFMSTMQVIRIFTKPPGTGRPSEKAVLIRQGSTVMHLAETIHGELAKTLRYARIWRAGSRVMGMRVGGNFPLKDMDVVELRG